MGVLDKIKAVIGVEEDYDDFFDDEPIQQPTSPRNGGLGLGSRQTDDSPMWRPASTLRPQPLREREEPVYQDPPVRQPRYPQSQPQSPIRKGGSNIVDMSPGSQLRALTQKFRIVVVEPRVFEESTKLVDNLKSRKPVIINLEKIETDTARKIFDFLSGATYALSGNVQKIANNIFVFLPENVDVSTSTDHDGMTFGAPDGNPWPR